MRSLLIVDDEIYIVQGILSAMPWEDLGIGPVYSAYSMQQAISVFSQHPVDILICDIEMPQGSGIDLLQWVSGHSPQTVSLLLTCHADFDYAQQAIRLGCIDYLLKPVPYEKLEMILMETVSRVEQARQFEEYNQFGQLWEKNADIVESKFWFDLIQGGLPGDYPSIAVAAGRALIPIDQGHRYLPILVSLKIMNAALADWAEDTLAFAISNMTSELLLPLDSRIPVLKLNKTTCMAILEKETVPEDQSLEEIRVRQACQQLMLDFQRYLDSQFACYIGEWSEITALAQQTADLQLLDRQNVAYFNEVMSRVKPAWRPDQPSILNTLHWQGLLESGNTSQIYHEAVRYLDEVTNNRQMTATILRQFYLNFTQAVYAVLSRAGILVHQLFPAELVSGSNLGIMSVEQVKATIKTILSTAEKQLDIAVHSKSLVEQLQEYIQQNLDHDLSCEDIGSHFFLHADHLTRLLKKETGLSLSDLIVREKINFAQALLSRSSLPISQIAIQVGYSNISHFTNMFRRVTGKNPTQWRKEAADRKIDA